MDRKTKPPDLFSQREELSVNLKNGKMMSKVLLYLLMITCMLTRVSSTEVKWKVLDTSPKLGQNLTLFCKVDNCTVDGIKRWYGGPDVKPLMSNSGISADKRKYNTSIEKNGFILTILNLTVKDLNVSYECSCGFDLDNHILYIEDVYRVDNLNKSTNGTNDVETINVGWGVIIGYIAIPVILVILLLIFIIIKRHWLWKKLKEKIYCPRGRNSDLDDNLHGSQLLQHPQESINRVTDEVDGQSVTDPLLQTTPVDSNPRQSSDEVDGQSVTDPLLQTTPVDSNPRQSSDEAVSLSKEVNNFFRLFYLCQKIATQAVRFFFDSKVPGHTLESFLNQHKSVLTSKKNVYRCTKDQKAKLFPGGHVVVVSADFDFNMLYKLIRNLVATLPAPTRGWGKQPSSGDLNEGDDIERIRYLRNFLAHSTELEICDADFSTRWIDLSQAIARLSKKGSLSTDVESMRTKSFDICIKNEIEEDIRKEQKQMCKDFAEIQKQVDANKENIADNKQNIADIKQNTADNTKDIADIKQNITDNKPSIADNKQEIHNSITRHTTNTQSKLSDKVVLYVASQLGSDWTQVVLLLGIKQSEIEQIKMDNQGRSIEQITVALFKWRNRQNNRPEDTIKQLIEALEFPGRQDIIDNLREKYEIY